MITEIIVFPPINGGKHILEFVHIYLIKIITANVYVAFTSVISFDPQCDPVK